MFEALLKPVAELKEIQILVANHDKVKEWLIKVQRSMSEKDPSIHFV